MDLQKVTNQYRLNHWAEIIKKRQSSGITVKAWCEEHNINIKSYYYWLKKVRIAACNSIPKNQSVVPIKTSRDNKTVFAEIKVPESEYIQAAITLKLNEAVLEIHNGATTSVIENTLKALKSIC